MFFKAFVTASNYFKPFRSFRVELNEAHSIYLISKKLS